jgi:drug/metabolite transporter superfamily protein YnfA
MTIIRSLQLFAVGALICLVGVAVIMYAPRG